MNPDLVTVNAFVEELARLGVRHICVSPGSRSTPLTMAVSRHGGFKVWLLLDERSAAFFALGLAKSTGVPSALICTSGTATANYGPAVMEAAHSGVPLIVLTADRPPELRQVGANQTVDQVKLYGSAVKWSIEMPVPQATEPLLRQARATAWRAFAHATSMPRGPVHVNWPFREPLVPPPFERPSSTVSGVRVYPADKQPNPQAVTEVATLLLRAKRPIVVCGPQPDMKVAEAIYRFAQKFGIPLLADPLSQIREVANASNDFVVDAYDMLLRDGGFASAAVPDVILRFGQTPTSKVLGQYLERYPNAEQVLVAPHQMWHDPFFTATFAVESDEVRFCDSVCSSIGQGELSARAWTALWKRANELAWMAAHEELANRDWSEAQVLPNVVRRLPHDALLFVGNSMPVRDLDSFVISEETGVQVLANRGASGIDGVISTALGCAAGLQEKDIPVVLVIGDVSFYHDLNGLFAAARYGLKLCIVLIHNDGGGIFSFLPQADSPETFPYFDTPHGVHFGPTVEMYGGRYSPVSKWDEFKSAFDEALRLECLTVLEVCMDKSDNVQHHREVFTAVKHRIEQHGLLQEFRELSQRADSTL